MADADPSSSFINNLELGVAGVEDEFDHVTGLDPNADNAALEYQAQEAAAGVVLTSAQADATVQAEANGGLDQAAAATANQIAGAVSSGISTWAGRLPYILAGGLVVYGLGAVLIRRVV